MEADQVSRIVQRRSGVEVTVGYHERPGAWVERGYYLQVWPIGEDGVGISKRELYSAGIEEPIPTIGDLVDVSGRWGIYITGTVANLLRKHAALRDRQSTTVLP